jgi:hypothetical protein
MIDTLRELLARLASFFHKQARDVDFDQEMTAHLEFAVQENCVAACPSTKLGSTRWSRSEESPRLASCTAKALGCRCSTRLFKTFSTPAAR